MTFRRNPERGPSSRGQKVQNHLLKFLRRACVSPMTRCGIVRISACGNSRRISERSLLLT